MRTALPNNSKTRWYIDRKIYVLNWGVSQTRKDADWSTSRKVEILGSENKAPVSSTVAFVIDWAGRGGCSLARPHRHTGLPAPIP